MMELKILGRKIKLLRLDNEESITEVAKSIKIDRAYLSRIENGHERPSERLLNELISHFNLSSDIATELFVLAGYKSGTVASQIDKGVKPMANEFKIPTEQPKQLQVNMPAGLAVYYSDSVVVNSNQWGVVFDFGQSMGPNPNQTNIVSRIGMSKDHAKALLEVLKKNLETPPIVVKNSNIN